jgi:hypothetical protein
VDYYLGFDYLLLQTQLLLPNLNLLKAFLFPFIFILCLTLYFKLMRGLLIEFISKQGKTVQYARKRLTCASFLQYKIKNSNIVLRQFNNVVNLTYSMRI